MFKQSRRKIVAAIMSILVLLWVGTLAVIYLSSFFEMQKQNEQMLQAHAQAYALPPEFKHETVPVRPMHGSEFGGNPGSKPGFDSNSPKYRLTTFYTVALSYDGTVLVIENEPPTIHTDDSLAEMAKHILETGVRTGTENNLTFLQTDKGSYYLITFMDNTVINESAETLLRNTLIFGSILLVPLFFLSLFLAKNIVAPLESSYQKQKQFISDAGHELKTPISVISANTELLCREIGDNRWLQNIQYETERMGLLVGQLLDLARTENVTPQIEQLDLSHLVMGEALPFESVAFEKGLELNCHITHGITVDGSSTQLKQLTSILLDNAIRHSKSHGEVRLTLVKEHGMARLSVINHGDAIPPEQREQIFERFYRVDTARTGDDQHYGLGLAIAKAITQTHQGHIQVLCHDGLVEFQVRIPAAKE